MEDGQGEGGKTSPCYQNHCVILTSPSDPAVIREGELVVALTIACDLTNRTCEPGNPGFLFSFQCSGAT